MSRREVNIPFLGINRQPLDRQRRDGECTDIFNLRPEGPADRIRWTPVRQPRLIQGFDPEGGLLGEGARPAGTGIASGSISMRSPAASPDPFLESFTTITPLEPIASGRAEAFITVAGQVNQAGTISVTLGNLPTQSGTFVIPVAAGQTAGQVADLIRVVLAQNFVTNALELVRETDTFMPDVEYLRMRALAPGAGGNSYTVSVSTTPNNIVVIDAAPFTGGGTGLDTDPEVFRVVIGSPSGPFQLETGDIVITEGNNTVIGISAAIVDAVNQANFVQVSASNVGTELGPGAGLFSTPAILPEDLNGTIVFTTSSRITWAAPQPPFANGINRVTNWGPIQIDMPGGVSVQTAGIAANETRVSILGKIVTALNADPAFTESYEIINNGPIGKSISIKALQAGTEFNGPIELIYDSRMGNLLSSDLSGGVNTIGPIQGAAWYKRVKRGSLSKDITGSLDRMIALQSDRIVVSDPGKNNDVTVVDLIGEAAGRHLSFAQAEDLAMYALSRDDKPELTKLIVDDTFFDYKLPTPPKPKLSHQPRLFRDDEHDAFGLRFGLYAIRTAWVFADGSYSALSVPVQYRVQGAPATEEGVTRRGILTVTVEVPELGSYSELIEGVAVFISTQLSTTQPAAPPTGFNVFRPELEETDDNPFDAIFYEIGTIPKGETQLRITRNTDQIFTLDNAREDNLFGIHEIKASIVSSYNKRFILGNTSVDFVDPLEFITINEYGDETGPRNVVFVVGIKSDGRQYLRISEPIVVERSLDLGNPIAYPDARAEWLEVWAEYDNEYVRLLSAARGEKRFARIELTRSKRNNFAWAPNIRVPVPASPPTYPEGIEDVEFYGFEANNQVDQQPGRCYASEPYNPFVIPAAQTFTPISEDSTDPVIGFAANALPISEGQFGDFPLYVFTRNSITALGQGGPEVAFGTRTPVSTTIGAVNQNAIVNVERGIAFMGSAGVYFLPSELSERISEPIGPAIAADNSEATLGFFRRGEIRELWVSNIGGETWCLNLDYMRWFRRGGGVRTQFFMDGQDLYSIIDTQAAQEEAVSEPVLVRIDTGTMNFGEPDLFKRLFMGQIKWSITAGQQPVIQLTSGNRPLLQANFRNSLFYVAFGAMKNYRLQIEGTINPQDWIESFDVSVQFRYPHRRIRK